MGGAEATQHCAAPGHGCPRAVLATVAEVQSVARLGHDFEPFARPLPAPDLRERLSLDPDDVRREVVRAADERRTDAVDVRRHAGLLERADLVDGEAARRDDPHAGKTLRVEGA